MSKVELNAGLMTSVDSSPSVPQKKTSTFFPSNPNEYTPRINDVTTLLPDGISNSFVGSPFSSRNPPLGAGSKFFSSIRPNSQTSVPVAPLDSAIDFEKSTTNILSNAGTASNDITGLTSSRLNDSLSMLSITYDDKENDVDGKSYRPGSIWNDPSRTSVSSTKWFAQEEPEPLMFTPSFLSLDSLFIDDFSNERGPPNLEASAALPSRNIYLAKVNNPSFIPTSLSLTSVPIPAVTDPVRIVPQVKKGPEVKNARNQSKDSNHIPLKQNKPARKETRANMPARAPLRSVIVSSVPISHPSAEKDEIHPSKCVVNLPQSFKFLKGLSKPLDTADSVNKVFKEYLLAQDNTKQIYHEDYCSTFYKRNHNGYMFVKEPANSIKINSNGMGTKSWVQIRLSLPNGQGGRRPGSKKFKIDIRQLPNWKPPSNKSSSKVKRSSLRKRESTDFSQRKNKTAKRQPSSKRLRDKLTES